MTKKPSITSTWTTKECILVALQSDLAKECVLVALQFDLAKECILVALQFDVAKECVLVTHRPGPQGMRTEL